MKKNLSALAALFCSAALFSQVGINNSTPKATLDITAKTTDGSKPEGLIAPRLTGDQIKAADTQYGPDQKGTIVYATAAVTASTVKTAGITAEGYYFFDGSVWQKIGNATAVNSWGLNGNAGSDPTVNFIGTTDNEDLVFKSGGNHVGYLGNAYGPKYNTTLGWQGQSGNLGEGNVRIGAADNYSLTDSDAFNTFIGTGAGGGGSNNVAIGYEVSNGSTGNFNTAVGDRAAHYLTTGGNNTLMGNSAGYNITTGSNNTLIGTSAGYNISAGSKNIVLGNGQNAASATGDNQLNIGGAIFGTGLSGSAASPAGNIGIGTASPASKLEINGSATNTSAYDAGSSTTIDFSKSNLAYTSASAGNFTLQNIKDGGTYTLSVRGAVSGVSSFTAAGITFKYVNNNASIAGTDTLYTFVIMGSTGYVYCVRGL